MFNFFAPCVMKTNMSHKKFHFICDMCSKKFFYFYISANRRASLIEQPDDSTRWLKIKLICKPFRNFSKLFYRIKK